MKLSYLLATLAAFTHTINAAPGDLDLSFEGTGVVTTSFANQRTGAHGVAIQADGKVVVVGHSYNGLPLLDDFTVVRYNASGTLDTSFNGTGKVITDIGGFSSDGEGDYGRCVAIQSDGKIVVAGYARVGGTLTQGGTDAIALVRYNTNGSLDTTFNITGKVITNATIGDAQARCIALQSDGKIVVAGSTGSEVVVARYNENGSLDTTFNGTGVVSTPDESGRAVADGIAIQNDGKILVSSDVSYGYGIDVSLLRYNTNGTLDTSFNGTGKVITSLVDISELYDIGNSVAVQNDGKIVVVGFSGLARYNPNGTLDTTFNGTGKVIDGGGAQNSGNRVAIQVDDKIVVARGGVVSRYNGNGSLDATFGNVGRAASGTGVECVALQNDGRIVVAGYSGSSFVVARHEGGSATISTPPTLTAPTSGSVWTNSVSVEFYLPAAALPGSVRLTFTGTVTRVMTLTSGNESQGLHAFTLNALSPLPSPNIASGLPIPDGIYTVTISYQDALGLPAASSVLAPNVTMNFDTDGDRILDKYETGTGTYVSPTNTGTSPTNPDTDGDGLNDGAELNTYYSNPHIKDTDGDGFDDGFEVSTGFSPTSSGSTPDALSTIRTAVEFRFNAATGVSYRIEASTDLNQWDVIEPVIIGQSAVVTRFYSIENQPRRYFRVRRN